MKALFIVDSLEYFTVKFPYSAPAVQAITTLVPQEYRASKQGDMCEYRVHQGFFAKAVDALQLHGMQAEISVSPKIKPYFSKDDSILQSVEVKSKMYLHQIDAVKFEMTHKNFVIGDDQGLGKTLELLALATSLKKQGAKHCLIVCGVAGNVWNWQNEILTHTNEECYVLGSYATKNGIRVGSSQDKLDSLLIPHEEYFYVTNIETLRGCACKQGRKKVYPVADAINYLCNKGEITLVAVDECHKAKNPDAQATRALLKINSKRKAMMSGTLVMNNPLDLYVPLKWCGVISENFYKFKQEYCRFGGYGGYEIVGYKNTDKLKSLLSPIYLRRTKEEVLDLPEKVLTDEIIVLTAQQQVGYNQVEMNLQGDINQILFSDNPLVHMLHLRQYLSNPELFDLDIPSPKLERLKELVDNVLDSKSAQVIVYSQWSTVAKSATAALSSYSPAYVDGEVRDRMSQITAFQEGKTKVIIGTTGALGTGFTLNKATDVIFIDEPWNQATKNQAIDRAHRIGTKSTVNVHTLICKNTVDERIHRLIQKKGAMADELLAKDKPKLTKEEILYLAGMA